MRALPSSHGMLRGGEVKGKGQAMPSSEAEQLERGVVSGRWACSLERQHSLRVPKGQVVFLTQAGAKWVKHVLTRVTYSIAPVSYRKCAKRRRACITENSQDELQRKKGHEIEHSWRPMEEAGEAETVRRRRSK